MRDWELSGSCLSLRMEILTFREVSQRKHSSRRGVDTLQNRDLYRRAWGEAWTQWVGEGVPNCSSLTETNDSSLIDLQWQRLCGEASEVNIIFQTGTAMRSRKIADVLVCTHSTPRRSADNLRANASCINCEKSRFFLRLWQVNQGRRILISSYGVS